jgi:hypothetical protein
VVGTKIIVIEMLTDLTSDAGACHIPACTVHWADAGAELAPPVIAVSAFTSAASEYNYVVAAALCLSARGTPTASIIISRTPLEKTRVCMLVQCSTRQLLFVIAWTVCTLLCSLFGIVRCRGAFRLKLDAHALVKLPCCRN